MQLRVPGPPPTCLHVGCRVLVPGSMAPRPLGLTAEALPSPSRVRARPQGHCCLCLAAGEGLACVPAGASALALGRSLRSAAGGVLGGGVARRARCTSPRGASAGLLDSLSQVRGACFRRQGEPGVSAGPTLLDPVGEDRHSGPHGPWEGARERRLAWAGRGGTSGGHRESPGSSGCPQVAQAWGEGTCTWP